MRRLLYRKVRQKMKLLLDYTLEELKEITDDLVAPAFVAGQIYLWLNRGYRFDEMSNVSKQLRDKLAAQYDDIGVNIVTKLVSKDKTEKYLFRLSDGNVVEGVLMNYKYGNTLCVSTQVGCRMGCAFCASTIGGLVRNLSVGEILGQVVSVNRLKSKAGTQYTNVVLMAAANHWTYDKSSNSFILSTARKE